MAVSGIPWYTNFLSQNQIPINSLDLRLTDRRDILVPPPERRLKKITGTYLKAGDDQNAKGFTY